MKKISIIAILLLPITGYAATTPLGNAIADTRSAPRYLIDAADAWNSIIGQPMRGGTIASRMSAMNDGAQTARLYDVMSILAYNFTPMTIYQTNMHLNAAYSDMDIPLATRRMGAKQNFILDAHGFGATDKYEHGKNDDFEMHTGGAGARAYAYVTNGLTFGVGYSYAKSKSHDMALRADATSNIVSLFSKYLGQSGMYMNMALAAGQTRWDLDKTVVGVGDKTSFDTNFYSGQATAGIKLNRGRMFLTPSIGTRYTYMNTEKHIDAAAQDFKKWWYNTLAANADARVGFEFTMSAVTFTPSLHIGAGYDIIHSGTNNVKTRLVTGDTYYMPVHAPGRGEINGGGGIGIYGGRYGLDAIYTMHKRSDYTAHTMHGGVKIAF
ncbi:autotransporter outer membrane beta-barrel domain-containing protein [bacterium]|nr:autotransporter outer membrane beta-barrel domain-containing protein [bacterium]